MSGSARDTPRRRDPPRVLRDCPGFEPPRSHNGTFLQAAIRHNTNLQKFEFCLALEWWL